MFDKYINTGSASAEHFSETLSRPNHSLHTKVQRQRDDAHLAMPSS